MRHKFGLVAFVVSIAAGLAPASALASGTAQGPPAAPITQPFQQCAAVYQDPSCGYLIDITGASTSNVLVDPSIGFYEGSDDVLVGVQNDSSAPVSSLQIGFPGSGYGVFSFDGDGLCTPGGNPVPADCPFGPVGDPGDYYGPDATLTVDAGPCFANGTGPCSDDGKVNFPTPLAPGQYTYFSLEAPPNGASVTTGSQNDGITTQLSDGTNTGAHLTDAAPTALTDSASLAGPNTSTANGMLTYAVYSDPACTVAAGTPQTVAVTNGSVPTSAPFGASLPTNAIYYVKASYAPGTGDANTATTANCGDETVTFGTPPAKPIPAIVTNLVASSGASGAALTVPTGTAVHDTVSVTSGGAAQAGRVSYYVYSDAGCTQPSSPAVSLGGGASTGGAYPASNTVTLPDGTYYFQAVYSGNKAVQGGHSACTEVLNVEPPCACARVSAYLSAFHVFGAGTTKLEFNLRSAIACTVGPGGCAGALTVTAPKGAAFVDSTKARNGATGIKLARSTATLGFRCAGPCAASTVQTPYTLQWLAFTTIRIKVGKGRHRHFKTVTIPNPRFLPNGRAKKTFTVTATEVCNGITTTRKLVIAFDKHGQVDYKKSDLNGDGLPDGGRLTDANGFI
jgi:hypothetical protein